MYLISLLLSTSPATDALACMAARSNLITYTGSLSSSLSSYCYTDNGNLGGVVLLLVIALPGTLLSSVLLAQLLLPLPPTIAPMSNADDSHRLLLLCPYRASPRITP